MITDQLKQKKRSEFKISVPEGNFLDQLAKEFIDIERSQVRVRIISWIDTLKIPTKSPEMIFIFLDLVFQICLQL